MSKGITAKFADWVEEHGTDEAERRRDKYRAAQREWSQRFYEANRDKVIHWVMTRQGKTIAFADRPRPLFCEICGGVNKNGKKLAFDHCHASGEFRGWLCMNCNSALGLAQDSPDILKRMADYLTRHRKRKKK